MKITRHVRGSIDIHVIAHDPARTPALVAAVVQQAAGAGISAAGWEVSTAWTTGPGLERLRMHLHLWRRLPVPQERARVHLATLLAAVIFAANGARCGVWVYIGPRLSMRRDRGDIRIRADSWGFAWPPTPE